MSMVGLMQWWLWEGRAKSPLRDGDPLQILPGHFLNEFELEWRTHRIGVLAEFEPERRRLEVRIQQLARELESWFEGAAAKLIPNIKRAMSRDTSPPESGDGVGFTKTLEEALASVSANDFQVGEPAFDTLQDWLESCRVRPSQLREAPLEEPLWKRIPLPLHGELIVVDDNRHFIEVMQGLWFPFVKDKAGFLDRIKQLLAQEGAATEQNLALLIGQLKVEGLLAPTVVAAAAAATFHVELQRVPRSYREVHRELARSPYTTLLFLDGVFATEHKRRRYQNAVDWMVQCFMSWSQYMRGPGEYVPQTELDSSSPAYRIGLGVADLAGWLDRGETLRAEVAWPLCQMACAALTSVLFWRARSSEASTNTDFSPPTTQSVRKEDDAGVAQRSAATVVAASTKVADVAEAIVTFHGRGNCQVQFHGHSHRLPAGIGKMLLELGRSGEVECLRRYLPEIRKHLPALGTLISIHPARKSAKQNHARYVSEQLHDHVREATSNDK